MSTLSNVVHIFPNDIRTSYIAKNMTTIKCVRVFKIENNGELVDKCNKNVDILCEYDPQGINLKVLLGKYK